MGTANHLLAYSYYVEFILIESYINLRVPIYACVRLLKCVYFCVCVLMFICSFDLCLFSCGDSCICNHVCVGSGVCTPTHMCVLLRKCVIVCVCIYALLLLCVLYSCLCACMCMFTELPHDEGKLQSSMLSSEPMTATHLKITIKEGTCWI